MYWRILTISIASGWLFSKQKLPKLMLPSEIRHHWKINVNDCIAIYWGPMVSASMLLGVDQVACCMSHLVVCPEWPNLVDISPKTPLAYMPSPTSDVPDHENRCCKSPVVVLHKPNRRLIDFCLVELGAEAVWLKSNQNNPKKWKPSSSHGICSFFRQLFLPQLHIYDA